jgi:hypothetical protein
MDHFQQVPFSKVVKDINDALKNDGAMSESPIADSNTLSKKFWHALDALIGPHADDIVGTNRPNTSSSLSVDCGSKNSEMSPAFTNLDDWRNLTIYSYVPNDATGAGDPYDDESDGIGSLWSFHYFFFHRRFKRLVFFTMRAVR